MGLREFGAQNGKPALGLVTLEFSELGYGHGGHSKAVRMGQACPMLEEWGQRARSPSSSPGLLAKGRQTLIPVTGLKKAPERTRINKNSTLTARDQAIHLCY